MATRLRSSRSIAVEVCLSTVIIGRPRAAILPPPQPNAPPAALSQGAPSSRRPASLKATHVASSTRWSARITQKSQPRDCHGDRPTIPALPMRFPPHADQRPVVDFGRAQRIAAGSYVGMADCSLQLAATGWCGRPATEIREIVPFHESDDAIKRPASRHPSSIAC
jgi:hypothetical protein